MIGRNDAMTAPNSAYAQTPATGFAFTGPTLLVKSSGLAKWQRLLFSGWRHLAGMRLSEHEVQGLHGSMFEAANIGELAGAIADQIAATSPGLAG